MAEKNTKKTKSEVNLNQQSTLKTVRACVCMCVYHCVQNCHTQYSKKQFRSSSSLSSGQTSLLRYCQLPATVRNSLADTITYFFVRQVTLGWPFFFVLVSGTEGLPVPKGRRPGFIELPTPVTGCKHCFPWAQPCCTCFGEPKRRDPKRARRLLGRKWAESVPIPSRQGVWVRR